jgi:hypothetical protein
MTNSKLASARYLPGLWMFTAVALAVSCIAAPAIAASTQPPAGTRAMKAGDVYELYKNKSWQWKNGAGYMEDAGRHFSAWTDDEKGKAWADGHWSVTNTGALCLKAKWHSAQGDVPTRTCFAHRVHNGTIYQRRKPDGAWYIFSHAEARDDDEAHKLVSSDLVSQQRDRIKIALGKPKSNGQ